MAKRNTVKEETPIMNTKFKVGDRISPVIMERGFENALITKIDSRGYHLSIDRGTAVIPLKAEEIYELSKKSKKK